MKSVFDLLKENNDLKKCECVICKSNTEIYQDTNSNEFYCKECLDSENEKDWGFEENEALAFYNQSKYEELKK